MCQVTCKGHGPGRTDTAPASRRSQPSGEDGRAPKFGAGPQLCHSCGTLSECSNPTSSERSRRGSLGNGPSAELLRTRQARPRAGGARERSCRRSGGYGRSAAGQTSSRDDAGGEGEAGAEGPAGGLATQDLSFHFKSDEKPLTGFQQGGSCSDLCFKDTRSFRRRTWVAPRRGRVFQSEMPGILVVMETYPACVNHRPLGKTV